MRRKKRMITFNSTH